MADGEHIRALIAQRHDGDGWSYRKIAQQAGGKIGHTFIQKLATRGRKTAPAREDLEALAEGLQIPRRQVFEAATKDWTTPPELLSERADDGSIIVIASQLAELPDTDVQMIKDMTDTLFRRMKDQERRRASQ